MLLLLARVAHVRHAHLPSDSHRSGAFLWERCRCRALRLNWMAQQGDVRWSSSWGTRRRVGQELHDYATEPVCK